MHPPPTQPPALSSPPAAGLGPGLAGRPSVLPTRVTWTRQTWSTVTSGVTGVTCRQGHDLANDQGCDEADDVVSGYRLASGPTIWVATDGVRQFTAVTVSSERC